MKNKKNIIIESIIGIVLFAISYYITLPAINIHSASFWSLIIFISIYMIMCIVINQLNVMAQQYKYTKTFNLDIDFKQLRNNKLLIPLIILIIFSIIAPSIWSLVTSPIFNAKEYSQRIDVKEVGFDEVPELDSNKTPIIDRDSTIKLGDKVMGQMSDLVSQFNVSNEYTQISYNDSIYRVTPLEYAGLYKYFSNRNEGIPAYISVNSTTGESQLVRLKDLGLDNMRYTPSAMFNDNLSRRLRFAYPSEIFGSPSFEIDDEGYPYYICTTYTYKGVGNMKSVTGVIVFDPITGDSNKYDLDNIPNWVDRVYPEDLIIDQVNNYGFLSNGFFNSIFGQEGVIQPSAGYNYVEKDGDIWLYTGLTSANTDASNLGFILVNTRTHEALRIATPGADEYSAMDSAEGEVKNYGYKSTFPLLVNIKGNPVYLMSLKDDAGLVKMYATVSVIDFQKVTTVAVDEGLKSLADKTITSLGSDGIVDNDTLVEKEIVVSEVEIIINDANTYYYIKDIDGNMFKIKFEQKYEDKLVFLQTNDKLIITYIDIEGIKTIKNIK